jgi:predicted outer membrane repeat protein
MRKKRSWHIALSLLLIGLLLAELLPITGIAQNDSENEVIVSFDMPVTEIIVPLGTEKEDIPLPETLAATLEEGTVVDIPVIWEDSGVYNKEAAGTYLFTADIGTWIYAQARPIAVVTVVPPGIHISGKLWLDKNDDGIRDADETGIAGYPVTLYAEDDLNTPVQTTLTKADGGYWFEGMEPGSYVVRVTSETIGETEYLLPQAITNDNKFALDEDAVASWSVSLEIGEGAAVTDIDAGMRLPEGIMPLSFNAYNFDDIKNAINQALPEDSIVIVIQNDIEFLDDLVIKKNLNIKFETPGSVNSVTLTSAEGHRHFTIENNATIKVELTFEKIVLAGTNTGGGIAASGDFVLDGAEIMNCHQPTGNGGGVITSTLANSITLRNCNIYDNTANGAGGGVYVQNADLTVFNCEIFNNSENGQGGGGVCYIRSSSRPTSFYIQKSSIHDNISAKWGGGVLAVIGDENEISNSDIYNNRGQEGGGIYIMPHTYSPNSVAHIVNNTIYHNYASQNGGGIYADNLEISIDKGNISDNTAEYKGGGIYTTDLNKLSVSEAVTFDNNIASVPARPFKNMIDQYPGIETASNSIYGHPLNNYDINVLVVTVSKTVKGDYADKTKEFQFTICLADSNGEPLSTVTDDSESDESLTLNDQGEYSFLLKHDEKISFAAVSEYRVQVRESLDSNYDKVYLGEELLEQMGDSWITDEVSLPDKDIKFNIINSRKEVVPAGVIVASLQGPVLLALSMLLLMVITSVGMIHSRRKRGL